MAPRASASRTLDSVDTGVLAIDEHGRIRAWNTAAEAITGLPRTSLVGQDVGTALGAFAEALRSVRLAESAGSPSPGAEIVRLTLADEDDLALVLSGVETDTGPVYTFRSLTADEEADARRREFLTTLTHELKSPLASIYSAAAALRRDDIELEPDAREKLLAVIAGEAARLRRAVNDILSASRLESGKLQLRIEPCDADAVVREVVAAARLTLPESTRVELAVPADLPRVAADSEGLRHVLVNLLENAVKYSPEGGSIVVTLDLVDARVRFSIRDQGIGIPDDEQPRVFEKFYRLESLRTTRVEGTGLGLYITRELLERMDGRIWISSEEGAGSTFFFDLPVAAERAVTDRGNTRSHPVV